MIPRHVLTCYVEFKENKPKLWCVSVSILHIACYISDKYITSFEKEKLMCSHWQYEKPKFSNLMGFIMTNDSPPQICTIYLNFTLKLCNNLNSCRLESETTKQEKSKSEEYQLIVMYAHFLSIFRVTWETHFVSD